MTGPPRLLDPTTAARASLQPIRTWMALQRCSAFRPVVGRELLERHRDAARALERLEGPRCLDRILPELEFRRQLSTLQRRRVRGIPFGSPLYPERLATLRDASPLLWIRGDLEALALPAVAIVGARAPTAVGSAFAHRLARDLVGLGFAIVSGLARGIDSAAHRGALEGGGRTVAVLGCGPDRVYPADHAELAERLAAQGAVLSELPPGTPPLAHHFPLRNRLISGLSAGVVVVEARTRSGSLITARHALEQGREVLAVPGAVDGVTSAGSNLLLREGARAALDASDVVRALGWTDEAPLGGPGARRERSQPAHPIVRALHEEPATRDELARRLGCSAESLARDLLILELDGCVVEDRDGRLRAVTPMT